MDTAEPAVEHAPAVVADTPKPAPAQAAAPGGAALSLNDAILQAKLTVGPAVDPYEREADAVADRVVRSLSGGSVRRSPDGASPETAGPRVQRIQRAASVGAAGGEVDGDTDRAIRSSRGGGSAMPTEARSKMEGAFGADFSGIRIHEGSKAADLNNRIQAKAFTVGNDVFFRDGMPDMRSTSGQHLLAHELTHTIQQGGAAQRSMSAVGPIRRAPASVQRRTVEALAAVPKFRLDNTDPANPKMVADGDVAAGGSLEIENTQTKGAEEAVTTADAAVVTATQAQNTAAAALSTATNAAATAADALAQAQKDRAHCTGDDSEKSRLDQAITTAEQADEAARQDLQAKTDASTDKQKELEAAQLAAFRAKTARRAAGRTTTASPAVPAGPNGPGMRGAETIDGKTYLPLLKFPNSYVLSSALMQDFTDTSTNTGKKIDTVGAISGIVGAAGIPGQLAGAKKNLRSPDDLITDAGAKSRLGVAGHAVGAGSAILTLASGILRIKKAAEDGEVLDGLQGGAEIGSSLASGGAAVTGMIDSATSTAAPGTLSELGKASAGLAGFADVFNGIKSTFGLVKQAIDIYKRNKEPGALSRRSKHEKFQEAMGIITSLLEMAASGVSAAKNFLDAFSTGAGIGLATAVPGMGVALGAAELIVRGVAGIKARIQLLSMRKDKRDIKTKFNAENEPAVKAMVAKGHLDASEVRGEQGKKWGLAKLYKKLARDQDNGKPLSDEQQDFVAWGDTSEELQSYALSKGLQYVNKKRANRAVLKIAVAMTKIAGDVATLGGASAPVGMGLKAGAAVVDAGATIFRKIKQAGRNYAAGKSETSNWRKVFNSNKSSSAKMKGYNKDVDRIFDMIVALSKETDQAKVTSKRARLDRVFHAIGVSPGRMEALQNDPGALRAELIEYMQKRE